MDLKCTYILQQCITDILRIYVNQCKKKIYIFIKVSTKANYAYSNKKEYSIFKSHFKNIRLLYIAEYLIFSKLQIVKNGLKTK